MSHPLLLDIPVALETRRLHLRPPRTGDGAVLHAALVESLPELRRFLGFLPWIAEAQTPESAELRCRQCEANFITRADLPYFAFDKATGRLIGSAGLHRTDWSVPKTEVGYWVRSSAAGNGYVAEAVQALVHLALGQFGAQRVELVTDEDNLPSRRVAERGGFVLEGTHRNTRRSADGRLHASCVYARLASPA